MKLALLATFLCLAAALPKVRQVRNLNNPNRLRGEFIVVLHPADTESNNVAYASSVAAKMIGISSKINVIKSFTNLKHPMLYVKTTDEAVMNQLFQLSEVSFIESNLYELMIEQCQSQETTDTLWGLSRVSSVERPSYATATYSYSSSDGRGVRVYVLDTSVRLSHNDFDGRGEFGYNAVGGSNDDNNGHGTHCAGTVLGTLYGVAKGATVVAVKVLSDAGFGSTAGIIDGINFMVGDVALKGVPGVGSMSLGGGANSAMDEAVNDANAAGVPVVVAAGNSNANACNYSPARASGAITVGATTISDGLSSFSNYGTCVDILAPGSNILSAYIGDDDDSATLSGTSMACPHVAGEVAAFLSENPQATPAQVKAHLDSSSTKDAIDLRGTSGTPNYLQYSSCA